MRRTVTPIAALVLLALLAVAIAGFPGAAAAPEEIVAFNTSSLKFHCLRCQWAIKCTKNCVEVPRSEAIRRGGVPCKVCGGSCAR